MTAQPARRWHEQPASWLSLIVTAGALLCGGISALVSVAIANESRHSQAERAIALMSARIDRLDEDNRAQTDRMNRREAENRAAQAQIMALLEQIRTQLAVHEGRHNGLGLRAPLVTVK